MSYIDYFVYFDWLFINNQPVAPSPKSVFAVCIVLLKKDILFPHSHHVIATADPWTS